MLAKLAEPEISTFLLDEGFVDVLSAQSKSKSPATLAEPLCRQVQGWQACTGVNGRFGTFLQQMFGQQC